MNSVKVTSLAIPDVKMILPKKFGDHRGYFSETYSQPALIEAGLKDVFVQDNQSLSAKVGTVRGLHYQMPPFAQTKLVRVLRGRILDVAVDIRRSSPTFGRHVACEISAEAWNQVLVPEGFAHGFAVLEPDTEVLYKVTRPYAPSHEFGIQWDDPHLEIDWGVARSDVTLSEKDQVHRPLKDASKLFE